MGSTKRTWHDFRLESVMRAKADAREVVRCAISTWQCLALFKLDEEIQSPIEIGAGNVLLAASELLAWKSRSVRTHTAVLFESR